MATCQRRARREATTPAGEGGLLLLTVISYPVSEVGKQLSKGWLSADSHPPVSLSLHSQVSTWRLNLASSQALDPDSSVRSSLFLNVRFSRLCQLETGNKTQCHRGVTQCHRGVTEESHSVTEESQRSHTVSQRSHRGVTEESQRISLLKLILSNNKTPAL